MWVDVKLFFVLRALRVVACVAGGSFRASCLGLRRCFQGLGVCGWMLNCVVFFGCVVRLRASREAGLGRRASDCVVAPKVWGDIIFLFLFRLSRVFACYYALKLLISY